MISTIDTPIIPVAVTELGEGTPVVYLHDVLFDFFGEAGVGGPIPTQLAATHRVLAPTLPGFRDLKDLTAVDGVEDYSIVIADTLTALGVDAPHLVGVGLGGWIAAEVAVRHPGLMRTLTLVNAFGLRVEDHATARFFDAAAPNPMGGRREIRELLFVDPKGKVALDALPDHPEDADNALFFRNVHAAARIGWSPPAFYNPKLRSRLHRITAPTHVVWGADNKVVDTAHADAYAAGIAGSVVTLIEGAGYAINVEQPDSAVHAIDEFINRHDS